MILKDKVAIITGSSTEGIGFRIAEEYLKEGAHVVICGVGEKDTTDAKIRMSKKFPTDTFLAVKVDVTKKEDIENVFKIAYQKWGRIDILVNNAGIAPRCAIEDMSDNDFEIVMNINTFGAFRCTREAVKYMKDKGGSIINTSSFVSMYASPYQSAYTASKAALNGLTKSNARELGKYNIRVNAVCPGVIMTKMVKDTCNDQTIATLNAMTPLGRGGSVDDLAGIYVYLASDNSKFTTGAIINVDGGLVM